MVQEVLEDGKKVADTAQKIIKDVTELATEVSKTVEVYHRHLFLIMSIYLYKVRGCARKEKFLC